MPPIERELEWWGRDRRNFNRFLYRLDYPSYRYEFFDGLLERELRDESVKEGISKKTKDIYHIFRCGMVHGYFPKIITISRTLEDKGKINFPIHTIIARDAKPKGSIAIGQAKDDGKLVFAYNTYFKDFSILLDEWREILFNEKNEEWLKAFHNGVLKTGPGN